MKDRSSAYDQDLEAIGIQTFGDMGKFERWLDSPNSVLGGLQPDRFWVTQPRLKMLSDPDAARRTCLKKRVPHADTIDT